MENFREDLRLAYNQKCARKLFIWDYTQMNKPGDNYRTKINEAIDGSPILLLLLDPAYLESPETQWELARYQIRAVEDQYIIKVIKLRGEKANELNDVAGRENLPAFLTELSTSRRETEMRRGSESYKTVLDSIAGQIEAMQTDRSLKDTAGKIGNMLDSLGAEKKIFITINASGFDNHRVRFVKGLVDHLSHHSNEAVNSIQLLPDGLMLGVTSQAIYDLLCKENKYRESCLQKMLDHCEIIIEPLESDEVGECETLYDNMRFQVKFIKEYIQRRRLPLFIFANIPEVMYRMPALQEDLLNPAFANFKNIRILKGLNSTSFFESFVDFLERRYVPPPVVPYTPEKYLYLIANKEEGLAVDDTHYERFEDFFGKIKTRFVVLTLTRLMVEIDDELPRDQLEKVFDKHKEWVSKSNGIIIYQGMRQTLEWCQSRQEATFKAILELRGKQIHVAPEQAVYVDKLQPNRRRADYSYFKYSVLLDDTELVDFLCHIP